MRLRDVIVTILVPVIALLTSYIVLQWLPGRLILSFLISFGVAVIIAIVLLTKKFGIPTAIGFSLISAAVGSVVFLLLGASPSQRTDWESITIDCKKPIKEPDNPDPYIASVNLDGDIFWKEKNGINFTIDDFRDRVSSKPSTPFQYPGGVDKNSVKSKNGRTAGDRAKRKGKFKYHVTCANSKKYDPGIDVPRP